MAGMDMTAPSMSSQQRFDVGVEWITSVRKAKNPFFCREPL